MQLSAQLQQQVQPVLLPCQHVPAQCRLQCHSPQQQHTLSRRRHHYQQQRGTTLAAAAGAAAAGDGSTRGQKWRQRQQQQQQQQQQGQQQPGPPPRPSPPPIADASSVPPEGLADLFKAYATQLQAMQQQPDAGAGAGSTPGANVLVQNVSFHPPGSEHPLLDGVDFQLAPNQLGLVIGRSGSGKTTLLQLLAGLTEQTGGNIFIHRPTPDDHAPGLFLPTHIEQRMQQVGLVFQFPERHFLGDDVMQEMTFTWPRDVAYWGQRQAMAVRMQRVINAVGLSAIPFNIPPSALSGGQQRRLALALQLVRAPSLLLLDEPLAGLDWHARREVVALLAELKKEATLLVVSHDLADIAPLVDCAWRMEMGGKMEAVEWPPDSLSDMED